MTKEKADKCTVDDLPLAVDSDSEDVLDRLPISSRNSSRCHDSDSAAARAAVREWIPEAIGAGPPWHVVDHDVQHEEGADSNVIPTTTVTRRPPARSSFETWAFSTKHWTPDPRQAVSST